MATETRTITFTNAEIKQAIVRYCVKTGRMGSDRGAITGLMFSNEGGLSASFEPAPGIPRVTFQESEIAAAIILHCKDRGIPIARRSIKSLQVSKDAVSFTLTTPA
ncbi:MAG TPA: hypothetical protein VN823_11935 [Stellaceae bacterium]|nr:hypothetical protein [Stellaceae bacterium]